MFVKHADYVHAQYRNNADKPSYRKDTEKSSLLAFRDVQAPDASDWDDGNHEVCEDVDGGVGVPQPVNVSAL